MDCFTSKKRGWASIKDNTVVTGNSTLTVGLVCRSRNISIVENEKAQNAIKEVSKRNSVIMGDYNHGHIQWKSLQSTRFEDQKFFYLVQDSFLSHQGRERVIHSFELTG